MLTPESFIDTEAVFEAGYDADSVTYAEFTIVPGGEVNHASLVYWADGVSFLGGKTGTNWAISLYRGYHYNGQDLPISSRAARHVLETLSGTDEFASYDWEAQDWVYIE